MTLIMQGSSQDLNNGVQGEETTIQLLAWTRNPMVDYSRITTEAGMVVQMPPVMISPSGRMPVMHVKCIHELCIELLIFQSYLHHIRVISLFSIDFGYISQFPYFSGINPALAENPIFYILMFQGPKRCPNDLIFCGDHFFEGTKHRRQGST